MALSRTDGQQGLNYKIYPIPFLPTESQKYEKPVSIRYRTSRYTNNVTLPFSHAHSKKKKYFAWACFPLTYNLEVFNDGVNKQRIVAKYLLIGIYKYTFIKERYMMRICVCNNDLQSKQFSVDCYEHTAESNWSWNIWKFYKMLLYIYFRNLKIIFPYSLTVLTSGFAFVDSISVLYSILRIFAKFK